MHSETEPVYIETHRRGELGHRVEQGLELLRRPCRVCPRHCDVDRLEDEKAFCLTGRHAVVSSFFPHFGEEDCLRGRRGSGTIFFSHCNLKCVFCQNFDISQKASDQKPSDMTAPPDRLAAMMLDLERHGCHNINFVTPEHVVPQILEALPLAIEGGLQIPLVYNTSLYDSLESLRLLDGIIDIYMPDFKYWESQKAQRYSKAADYPDVARKSLMEMHRQVGNLAIDSGGIAKRGILLRHLVMPGEIAGTRNVMRFIAQEISKNTYVNLMDQYHPAYKSHRYPEIHRLITEEEYRQAWDTTRAAGIHRLDGRVPRRRLVDS